MIDYLEKMEEQPLPMQLMAAKNEAVELGVNYSGELNATELSRGEAAAMLCGVDYMLFVAEEAHHAPMLDDEIFNKLCFIRTRLIDLEIILENAGFNERISINDLLPWAQQWAVSIEYYMPEYLKAECYTSSSLPSTKKNHKLWIIQQMEKDMELPLSMQDRLSKDQLSKFQLHIKSSPRGYRARLLERFMQWYVPSRETPGKKSGKQPFNDAWLALGLGGNDE